MTTRRTVLQVEMYALDGPNPGLKVVFQGSISMDDKDVLSAQRAMRGNTHLFRNLFTDPIHVILTGHDDYVDINPKTNPRNWIKT